ncbi:MAG: arsenical pump-driving ATPase, partial [Proteobacteria bacterium]|nr:arsenical pump-driving ATPase [Pseudomonadota bacterium]
PWGWIINSSLAAAQTRQPLLQKRAEAEQEQIAKVRDQLSERYAVVPMQAVEPVGVEKLRNLCGTAKSAAAA